MHDLTIAELLRYDGVVSGPRRKRAEPVPVEVVPVEIETPVVPWWRRWWDRIIKGVGQWLNLDR
jgi:hypothetical protein